jgi:hypothetical protein
MLFDRHETAGGAHHQHLLFEGRFDRTSLAAQVMVSASRALPSQPPGRLVDLRSPDTRAD